jgi:phenylalanyl-tRNA synthetase beta chain
LASWRDIPEEVGRIYGYDKIGAILPKNTTFKPQVEKTFYYAEKAKNILVEQGFSEVYTYSLVPEGVYEIEKPLASDKNYLRTNLSDGILKSLALNAKNAELLGLDAIKIFEIGKVFTKEGEFMNLAIGVTQVKKVKGVKSENILAGAIESLNMQFRGMSDRLKARPSAVAECNFDEAVASLPEVPSYSDLNFKPATKNLYKKFSVYPFIVRDIAVFVPESVAAETVWESIQKGIDAAGAASLLERHSLFDAFKKEGKVSYAFRMVFQSTEKTLTDDEVNAIMEKIYSEMKGNGWEVR